MYFLYVHCNLHKYESSVSMACVLMSNEWEVHAYTLLYDYLCFLSSWRVGGGGGGGVNNCVDGGLNSYLFM